MLLSGILESGSKLGKKDTRGVFCCSGGALKCLTNGLEGIYRSALREQEFFILFLTLNSCSSYFTF